jgi:ELWxxDGT repeat protein
MWMLEPLNETKNQGGNATQSVPVQLVFIDTAVENAQILADGIAPHTEVIQLSAHEDGVLQISQSLASHSEVASVHIVSHGRSGAVQLGNTWLDVDNLKNYTQSLQRWSQALNPQSPILLYGCNVAAGEQGQRFVQQLAALVEQPVAASENLTGNDALGGDWELEVTTAAVPFALAFSSAARAAYPSVLVDEPVLVKDIWSGPPTSNPTDIVALNGTLYFVADNGIDGRELWRSNGTDPTTLVVKDINPGIVPSNPDSLTIVNNTIFFRTFGQDLWQSDGTEAGTKLVSAGNLGIDLTASGNLLYFTKNAGPEGLELWKSDPLTGTASLVADINPSGSSRPVNLTDVNGTLYFAATNGSSGVELWKSDGTAAGTVLIKNINPTGASSTPRQLTNVNGTLFFTADNGVNGVELWKSDGTTAGTVLVKDIIAGSVGAFPENLTNVNGTLFFTVGDGVNGTELWKSDGTAAGTVLVRDINPGSGGSTPGNLINVDGTLYFTADNGINGLELWKSDGTAAGTTLVKDIYLGSASSTPLGLTSFDGVVYFSATDGVYGVELWRSDGTAAGTFRISDLNPGAGDGSPTDLTYLRIGVEDLLFYSGTNGVLGTELWCTVLGPLSPWSIVGSLDLNSNGFNDVLLYNDVTGELGGWNIVNGSYEGWIGLQSIDPTAGWSVVGTPDINNNGFNDILFQNTVTGEIGAWNLINGVFSGWISLQSFEPTLGWNIVATGDLNNNNNDEIVFQNSLTGEVGAWNLVDGVFQSWLTLPTLDPSSGWNVVGALNLIDPNDAETDDILLHNYFTGETGAWIIENGAFSGWLGLPSISADSGWEIVATSDLNNDGFEDVILSNPVTNQDGAWSLDNGVVTGWLGLPPLI